MFIIVERIFFFLSFIIILAYAIHPWKSYYNEEGLSGDEYRYYKELEFFRRVKLLILALFLVLALIFTFMIPV